MFFIETAATFVSFSILCHLSTLPMTCKILGALVPYAGTNLHAKNPFLYFSHSAPFLPHPSAKDP